MTGRMMKNNMTRGMPRTMQHVQFDLAEGNLVSPLQPARWLEGPDIGEAKHLALLRHAFDPETIILMRSFNRHGDPLQKRSHTAGMIDMAMRDKNLGQRQLFLGQHLQDAFDIATRIDHRGLAGLFAPEDGAILFKGSNRNNGVAHGKNRNDWASPIIACALARREHHPYTLRTGETAAFLKDDK